jgi:hypothetical protein
MAIEIKDRVKRLEVDGQVIAAPSQRVDGGWESKATGPAASTATGAPQP